MKSRYFILPISCLVVVAGWGLVQKRSIDSIERESVVLKKQIARARASGADDPSVAAQSGKRKNEHEKHRTDWKKISSQMVDINDGGMADMRSMMRLQAQLQDMTADELLVAMDEIAALDIPAEAKTRLEQMLMGPLLQKEPELGLSRFIDRISDEQNGIAWQLSNALKEWAAKEPGKASAWFDEQIAAGKFDSRALDGKSESRIQFEGAMISALLSTDPGAARRRLQGIPEDQRGEVLQNHAFQSIKEQDQLAFVGLVRSELPVGEQPNTISRLASRLVSLGSYEKVTAFLERIDATPEERTKSVESAAESKIQNLGYREGVTRGEIDSMREWVAAQAPGSTDRVTGKALARSLRGAKGIKFPEAAALARQYGASSGNDEVVVSFLEDQGSSARAHRDEARELANSIADVKRREEILKRLD